jgi:alpha/beta superfamily hydrolase
MRLRALSKQLAEHGIACLRFDYGPWDHGTGEQSDINQAIAWATTRYDTVGLFGYSFGASLAIIVAADVPIDAIAVLAPAATIEGLSVTATVNDLPKSLPLFVVIGTRDSTVDWEPVLDAATDRAASIMELQADHFFIGKETEISREVTAFFTNHLP